MSGRFKQSWELFKASINVTLRHRKLLWFPVITACLTALIAILFFSAVAVPVVLLDKDLRSHLQHQSVVANDEKLPEQPSPASARHSSSRESSDALHVLLTGHPGHSSNDVATQKWSWASLYFVPIYFASMFLATFFNVAFYHEILAALDGRGVSFRRGLGAAWARLPSIFAWSLLAGVVGWAIRAMEQRLPFAGRIIASLVGLGWSIAAVFAIPVIITEQSLRNPVKILQQSAGTLKRTWGESLIGYVGFSAGNLLIFIVSLVPLALGITIAMMLNLVWVGIAGGVIWILGLILMGDIAGVAGHVYRCALYKYATEGVVPEPYSRELLDMAWRVKKS